MTVVACALGVIPFASADQSYSDPAGDAGEAPDVTSVSVSNDFAERVTFRIGFADPAAVTVDTAIWIMLDLDRNGQTGGEEGEERRIEYDGADNTYSYWAWDGSALAYARPVAFEMYFEAGALVVALDRENLGTGRSFDFWVYADRYTADEITSTDTAPDGTAVWTYTFEAKQTRLRAQPPYGTPRFPVAGKKFVVTMLAFREIDGSRVTGGTVQCTARIGTRRLTARPSLTAGAAKCTLTVPPGTSGKLLTGSVALATPNGNVSRAFRFKIL